MPSPRKPRIILHADMDAFYASIEQRDHPELRGRPVIVGASSPRGVVAAASYEARRFGVRSAMPGFRARALCPEGVFLASDMEKYVAVSAEVHALFDRFTPEVEPLALDEAFLDVTGSMGLHGTPLDLARRLKRAVRDELRLDVSIGIGPNKLVAKIACAQSKPDGLLIVPGEAVAWLFDPLPVQRLWGVGPVLGDALARLGIVTIGDLGRHDARALARAIGDRASALQELARGHDDRPVESNAAPRSYGEESTFARDVVDRDVVTAALTAHAEAVARRLRADGYRGRTITLRVKLGTPRGRRRSRTPLGTDLDEPLYPLLTRARTLKQGTSDGAKIRKTVVALWDEARIAEPVRLLGVAVTLLERPDAGQLDLFADRAAEDRLGPALDAITRRFGKGAISRAASAPAKVTPSDRKKRGE